MKYKVILSPAEPKEDSVLHQTYYTEAESLDDLYDSLSFFAECGFDIVSAEEVSEDALQMEGG